MVKHIGRNSIQAKKEISNIFWNYVFSIILFHENIESKAIKYFRIVKMLTLIFNPSSQTNLSPSALAGIVYL